MKQTLFWIEREWFTTWILWGWLAIGLAFVLWNLKQADFKKKLVDFLPFFAIMTAVIYFVLPALSVPKVNPNDPLGDFISGGLAVRGYGLFMMLAIVISIGLVIVRCRLEAADPEPFITLCFVMIVCGLVGARVFYVVQKWPDFASTDPMQTLVTVVDMTKGGLVVYGSLIGGLIGAAVFLRMKKLPILATFDKLAPAMMLGLAIGRIGCLMNGCCYGGICGEDFPLGLRFPASSAPYHEQYSKGLLFGLTGEWREGEKFPLKILGVAPGSIGEQFGLQPGDEVNLPTVIEPERLQFLLENNVDLTLKAVVETSQNGDVVREVSLSKLPKRSMKIHPAQVYASVSAFLICGLLWFFYPLRRFDGQVIALLLMTYAVSRFIEEAIRVDEQGVFGTPLSISQWISIFTLVGGTAVYAVGQNRPGAKRPSS
jgi:phosphatidylglycerol:prolipoprotein diacylglycerol transferase